MWSDLSWVSYQSQARDAQHNACDTVGLTGSRAILETNLSASVKGFLIGFIEFGRTVLDGGIAILWFGAPF